MDIEESRKGEISDFTFGRNLLLGLLASIDKGKGYRFLTNREYALGEMANGTLAFVKSKDAGKFGFGHWGYTNIWRFHKAIYKSLTEALKEDVLSEKIKRSLLNLAKSDSESRYPDNPYTPHTNFYTHYSGHGLPEGIFTFSRRDLESITTDRLKIGNQFLESLDERERTEVKGIAEAMLSYIERDKKFLGYYYSL